MATINSIAIGKASGKLGGLVYSTKQGITYAKQSPARGKRISSPNQILAQEKLKNTYKAYSYIQGAKQSFKYYRKWREYNYNWFVKTFNYAIPTGSELTASQVCESLISNSRGEDKYIEIISGKLIGSNLKLNLIYNHSALVASIHVHIITWNVNIQGCRDFDHRVTEIDYNNGFIIIPNVDLGETGAFVVPYFKNGKWTGRMMFHSID